MNTRWERKRLAEFAAAVSTGPFGSLLHKSDYVDDGVPLVNPINIVADRIVPDPTKLIDETTKKRLSAYVLQEGDIAVARRGEIGRCAVIGPEEVGWVCGTGSFFIRPLPSIDPQFLAHMIRSDQYRDKLQKASSGATMPNLSNTALGDLVIAVPPLPEQQRIVSILDKAFEKIAIATVNADKNLENAQALFEGELRAVFAGHREDWEDQRIGDICSLKSGTTVPVAIERSSGDIPYVKVAEMTMPENRDGITTSVRFLNRLDIKSSWVIPAGAVIFPKRGGAILTNKKRLALVEMCADLNIMSVIPSDKLISDLLYLYFLAVDMRKLGTGSSIPQINNYDIAPLRIAFPRSTTDQKKLADRLRRIESECQSLETIYQRKVEALDVLKKSLLHEAFSGKL